MTTNAGFEESKRTNALNYRKYGLSSNTVYRNGSPFAGRTLITATDKDTLNSIGCSSVWTSRS